MRILIFLAGLMFVATLDMASAQSPVIAQAQQTINARTDGTACSPPNVASSLTGGVMSSLVICTNDEGEAILTLWAPGYNSNGTLVLMKSRGTQANPQPIKNGDVIGLISANGWELPGLLGGSPGSGFIRFTACADFTPTDNCTAIGIGTTHSGDHYPIPMVDDFGGQDGVWSVRDHFRAQGMHGVSCSGPPTSSFAVTGGIVTHC